LFQGFTPRALGCFIRLQTLELWLAGIYQWPAGKVAITVYQLLISLELAWLTTTPLHSP